MESDKAHKRKAAYGSAQVVLQAARKPGPITLKAQADGLPPAQVMIKAR